MLSSARQNARAIRLAATFVEQINFIIFSAFVSGWLLHKAIRHIL